jgi:hypothetical protein
MLFIPGQMCRDTVPNERALKTIAQRIRADLSREANLCPERRGGKGTIGPAAPDRLDDEIGRRLAIVQKMLSRPEWRGLDVAVDIPHDAESGVFKHWSSPRSRHRHAKGDFARLHWIAHHFQSL